MKHNLNENIIYIELPEIFNYELNLEYLKEHQEGILYHIKNREIRLVIDTPHGNTLVEIKEENGSLSILYLKGKSFQEEAHRNAIINYIENWFDLKTNLVPFYEMAKNDVILREPTEKYFGLRNVGFPNLFESLVSAIIGQQINIQFAYSVKQEFVKTYGEIIHYGGKDYSVFPHPEKVARETIESFSGFRATNRKKAYILDIAKRMVAGTLSKENLLKLNNTSAVEKELTKIKGVGPWTATVVAMRCLKYTDALPVADVGLINSIKQALGMDRKPTTEEIKKFAENWKGHESYATFYLWKALY